MPPEAVCRVQVTLDFSDTRMACFDLLFGLITDSSEDAFIRGAQVHRQIVDAGAAGCFHAVATALNYELTVLVVRLDSVVVAVGGKQVEISVTHSSLLRVGTLAHGSEVGFCGAVLQSLVDFRHGDDVPTHLFPRGLWRRRQCPVTAESARWHRGESA